MALSEQTAFNVRVESCWIDLLHKDDRTSPEEYPDMCLITRDELAEFMGEALNAARSEPDERVKGLVELLARFVHANDQALDFGLADCTNNYGECYQSADFAALISEAREALSTYQDKP